MNLVELSTNTINIIGLTPISDVGENNTAFDYELVFIRNWNPMGVLIGCILWTSFRKLLPVNTAGKILALLHAIVMLFMGVQVILKIGMYLLTLLRPESLSLQFLITLKITKQVITRLHSQTC